MLLVHRRDIGLNRLVIPLMHRHRRLSLALFGHCALWHAYRAAANPATLRLRPPMFIARPMSTCDWGFTTFGIPWLPRWRRREKCGMRRPTRESRWSSSTPRPKMQQAPTRIKQGCTVQSFLVRGKWLFVLQRTQDKEFPSMECSKKTG